MELRAFSCIGLLVAFASACGGGGSGPAPGDDGGPDPEPMDPVVVIDRGWEPCAPHDASMKAGPDCNLYEVPQRWADPASGTLETLVYRWRAPEDGRLGQVWLLDGGPGGTGAGIARPEIVDTFLDAGHDVYVPVPRGSWGSSVLSCDQPGEPSACRGELAERVSLAELAAFTTGETARDLAHLLRANADEEVPAALFGSSYGTYLALRTLQLDVPLAAVVLDGAMTYAPDVWAAGVYRDALVRGLFDACEADPVCAARFSVPVSEARARIADPTHCPALREEGPVGALLGATGLFGIPAVPLALASRIARCEEADVDALGPLVGGFGAPPVMDGPGGGGGAPPVPASQLNATLYNNVVAHDFLVGFDDAEYQAVRAEGETLAYATTTEEADRFRDLRDAWPVLDGFAPDPTVPEDAPPTLLLVGALDIQTPPAWTEITEADLGGQAVRFPGLGHGVLSSDLQQGSGCAAGIVTAFLADPTLPADDGCAGSEAPDLTGDDDPRLGQLAFLLFGDDDLWGDDE
ncbi:MAG TPA: alpha/beta fold hydrolase [Polyangiaceae bacterium LLY-WYZ-14_1]|nr:alpha/beta fold hydrolase [Polyangiaceae bacterium LLY-WYZ-14_1]